MQKLSKKNLTFTQSDSFWNEIIEIILPRLKDKIPIIRMYAVSSLARLQDPTDEEDDILTEFFRLLSHDSNKF
jgi:hypothetical protein